MKAMPRFIYAIRTYLYIYLGTTVQYKWYRISPSYCWQVLCGACPFQETQTLWLNVSFIGFAPWNTSQHGTRSFSFDWVRVVCSTRYRKGPQGYQHAERESSIDVSKNNDSTRMLRYIGMHPATVAELSLLAPGLHSSLDRKHTLHGQKNHFVIFVAVDAPNGSNWKIWNLKLTLLDLGVVLFSFGLHKSAAFHMCSHQAFMNLDAEACQSRPLQPKEGAKNIPSL